MADKKISQLNAATTPLAGTEVLPIVQSGATVKVSIADVTAGRPVSASSVVTNLGAVGTPAYTFTGDLNTGMWAPAADTIALSTGGSERLRVNSSGNVLDVVGDARVGRGGGTFQGLTLANNADSSAAETINFIDARNDIGTPDSHTFFAHQTDGGSYIAFATTPPGARNTDRRLERMRLNSVGNLGIGTGLPNDSARLEVASTTSGFLPPRMTEAQRDLISTPPNGLMLYNTTTDKLQVRAAGVWVDLH
jgi:hypothetical protein